jgi:hypothetical protein
VLNLPETVSHLLFQGNVCRRIAIVVRVKMVRFPKAPDTFVTLHVQCVSCNELFLVAEDEANATKPKFWRTPIKNSRKTELHRRPEHTHKLIRPLARAVPKVEKDAYEEWQNHSETAVNCPRCGTDNRNWLRLAYAPNPGGTWQKLQDTFSRSWLLWLSLLVTGFLLLRLFFSGLKEDESPFSYAINSENWFVYALMLVIIILGTLIPIMSLSSQWHTVRIHKILSKYDKTRSFFENISPGIKQGTFYFIFFVFVIPSLVYILLPRTTDAFQKETPLGQRIDQALVALDEVNIQKLQETDENELIPAINAVATLQRLTPNNLFLCNPTTIDTTLTKLKDVNTQSVSTETAVRIENALYHLEHLKTQAQNGTCNPQTVANAVLPLGELYTEIWQKCSTGTTNATASDPACSDPVIVSLGEYFQSIGDPGAIYLGTLTDKIKYTLQEMRTLIQQTNDPEVIAQVERELTTIERAIKRANDGPETLPGTSAMLNTWLKYVGLSCLVAVITSIVTANIYESKVRRHLPQPLCYSLSRLTRVVLWEACHTLEINGQFDRIEWNDAYRNDNGGITLRGYLCPPTNGQNNGKYIRAMSYTLISDLWGHIIVAEAKPVRVSPSVIQAWEVHEKQTKETLNRLFIQS